MRQCKTIINFNDASEQKLIEQKYRRLTIIFNYIFNSASCFSQEFYFELVQMFSANVFRALKAPLAHNEFEYDFGDDDDDDDDTFEDPAWYHLSPIYAIVIQLFLSPNFAKESASLYIDKTFTSKLIDMIDSPNFRVRNMIKHLLYHIYEKLIKLRSSIRKQICNVFLV